MKLTTKGRYAVTAMLDLALHQKFGLVRLPDIAERQGLSLPYLEQLFFRLGRAHLVKGLRGPGGGYRISRDLNEIRLSEIVQAVDEKLDSTGCNHEGNCHPISGAQCLSHEIWVGLSDHIAEYLNNITLQDAIDRRAAQRHGQQVSFEEDALAVPAKAASK